MKIGSLTTDNSYALDGMIEAGQATGISKGGVSLRGRRRTFWTGCCGGFGLTKKSRAWRSVDRRCYGYHGPLLSRRCGAVQRILTEFLMNWIESCCGVSPSSTLLSRPSRLIGIVGEIYLRTHVQVEPGHHQVSGTIWWGGRQCLDCRVGGLHDLRHAASGEDRAGARPAAAFGLCRINPRAPAQGGESGSGSPLSGVATEAGLQAGAIPDRPGRRPSRGGAAEAPRGATDLFSFEVGTEACLSIAGILEYARGRVTTAWSTSIPSPACRAR